MTVGTARTERVPTYCYQCVAGPDLLTVKVEDGVATEVEPNFCAAAVHPGGGKVCVKAFGLVQKTYNPNRVLTPMKRSNPVKGRDEDPGFVPLSWDEAFELRAALTTAVISCYEGCADYQVKYTTVIKASDVVEDPAKVEVYCEDKSC